MVFVHEEQNSAKSLQVVVKRKICSCGLKLVEKVERNVEHLKWKVAILCLNYFESDYTLEKHEIQKRYNNIAY